jgi:hypothetical protein
MSLFEPPGCPKNRDRLSDGWFASSGYGQPLNNRNDLNGLSGQRGAPNRGGHAPT